jgi:hypothetical protein
VVPTTRLLQYRDRHKSLSWHVRREPGHDLIVIQPAEGEEPGRESGADLADITFYCERPEVTSVVLDRGGELEAVNPIRVNPPDATSRPSITIAPQSPRARWP